MSVNKRAIMTLYSGRDIHSHRVRIALAEKGVTFDLIDVESVNARKDLAEYNPYVSVPTLIDRDLVLYNSQIIMEYLEERFPHPPLMPVYPVAKGRARLMIYRINRDWYLQMNHIISSVTSEEQKNIARKKLIDSMTSVIPVFAEMPFFLSEEFSLIDCCIVPLLWRLNSLKITLPPQAKAILDYGERMFARESFQASLLDEERKL